MSLVYFITHPDVVIDPGVPVPEWRLSPIGIERMKVFASSPLLAQVSAIWCSSERKAMDGAMILSDALDVPYRVLAQLGENDRSATGYLPKAEFEQVANAFFARPNESVRGWERAVDAQARIVCAVEEVIRGAPEGCDIAIVSHGGVGALYLAHVKNLPIGRGTDQPPGNGGYFFVFDRDFRTLRQDWLAIDA